MFKKFFSITNNFNIFDLVSLILITLGLYNKIFNLIMFGTYISIIPSLYISFIDYKNTKKIKFLFVLDIVSFSMFTFIFISKSISFLTKF